MSENKTRLPSVGVRVVKLNSRRSLTRKRQERPASLLRRHIR